MGEPKVSSSSSSISDAIFVERMMAQRESIESKSQGTVSKIPSKDTAKTQQTAKPETSRSDVKAIAQKVLGYSLMGLGGAAGLALFPATIPLGLFGAGIGYGIGKGMQALNLTKQEDAGTTGAVVVGGITSLLTGLVFTAGVLLVKNANNKSEEKPDVKEAKVLPEVKVDKKGKSKEASSDPDGVKFLMDKSRQAGDAVASYGTGQTHAMRLVYETGFPTFDINEKGPKYMNFFKAFNKEIELRNELGKIKTEINKNEVAIRTAPADRNVDGLKAAIEKLQSSVEEMSAKLNELKTETDQAYEEAIKPQR